MAQNSLYCADVPLSNCSLTHSRLLDQWKWRHKNQTRCNEHMEQSVDGQQQIAVNSYQQHQGPVNSNAHWCLTQETTVDGHGKLILRPPASAIFRK